MKWKCDNCDRWTLCVSVETPEADLNLCKPCITEMVATGTLAAMPAGADELCDPGCECDFCEAERDEVARGIAQNEAEGRAEERLLVSEKGQVKP